MCIWHVGGYISNVELPASSFNKLNNSEYWKLWNNLKVFDNFDDSNVSEKSEMANIIILKLLGIHQWFWTTSWNESDFVMEKTSPDGSFLLNLTSNGCCFAYGDAQRFNHLRNHLKELKPGEKFRKPKWQNVPPTAYYQHCMTVTSTWRVVPIEEWINRFIHIANIM